MTNRHAERNRAPRQQRASSLETVPERSEYRRPTVSTVGVAELLTALGPAQGYTGALPGQDESL